jgi:xylulokinase
MFLSNVFQETFADVSGARIELYNTDGAEGAARGAGLGINYYQHTKEAFSRLALIKEVQPKQNDQLLQAYQIWKEKLATLTDLSKI